MSTETGYLGFANLPNQVHRKYVKKGFEFTLMIVGESGLGKNTFINCCFMTNINSNQKIPSVADQVKRKLSIRTNTVDIEERGVKLKLTGRALSTLSHDFHYY
jgi:septin 2